MSFIRLKINSITFLISLVCCLLLSCDSYQRPESTKFDKEQWSLGGDGIVYPNRDRMLDDLLENHKLKGLTYSQLVETLGAKPDKNNRYEIVVHYSHDIDPAYVKVLDFAFDKDGVVVGWEVIENPEDYGISGY